jgi:hypothetical protein
MANNKLNGNENILVKVDQNNLIYIDPNSVVNNGVVEERGLKQENLVMYVNLEADLIPRSVLIDSGNKSTLVSIAKGTLNILKPTTGDYDTSWTNAYNGKDEPVFEKDKDGKLTPTGQLNINSGSSDGTAQSFGIESVNINIKGANFIPQININFVDVRGKTLFESPQDSPYKAFFHLPWPIFYLTVKGYYGKAIRYRLHLVKFNTKYNEGNGNFEVATTFVGSTYAYLNDIPLTGILNAPYMYAIETEKNTSFNEKTGRYEKKVSKSTRGYTMLKTVYDEYKSKGLLPKDFPVKTLREVITVARSLDKILEKEIFDQVVDMKIFAGIKEFEGKIQSFETAVRTWGSVNLEKNVFEINGVTGVTYSYLSGQEKTTTKKIEGLADNDGGTLEKIITNFPKELIKTQLFAEAYIKKGGEGFKNETFSFINQIKKIKEYYTTHEGKIVVNLNALLTDIFNIQKSFVAQRDKLETKVEQKMNEVIKDPQKGGIGFEPTVRNVIGVILANADVYIRLMKDVHNRAFEVADRRKRVIGNLEDESKDGVIYPWPEIKKQTATKQKVLAYPGDPDIQSKLQSFNKSLWPEIDFVENYHAIATKRSDPLSEKEGSIGSITYVFEENSEALATNSVSTALNLTLNTPYSNKTISSLLYELYERSRYVTAFDTFSNQTIRELALIDFSNIEKLLKEDYDVIDIINTVDSKVKLEEYLFSFSPYERYPYFQDQLPTTEYIKQILNNSFKIEEYSTSSKSPNVDSLYPKLNNNLIQYIPESYRKDIYPFSSAQYLSYINKTKFDPQELKVQGILNVNTKEGLISSPINSLFWVKDGYTSDIFARKLDLDTSDGLFSSVNILNTPYFHKQLFSDFTNGKSYGKYAGSAYLLLNSLPFVDLDEMVNFGLSSIRPSSLFKEIGASHYIPYHLMLKWGSIYHRYKSFLPTDPTDTAYDIISGVTTPISGDTFFNNNTNVIFTNNSNNIIYSGNTDIGIHPFYETIYHQIVNGYGFYDVTSGNTSYSATTVSGICISNVTTTGNGYKYWTSLIDNSKFSNSKDLYYTLLPSNGANAEGNLSLLTGFTDSEQSNFRTIWTDETIYTSFTGKTFPSYDEHHIDTKFNDYLVMDSSIKFKKVNDLIATFSPEILDKFEEYFLDFATEKVNVEMPYKKFGSVKHDNFQDLLKSIVTIKKKDTDPTEKLLLIKTLREQQLDNLKNITKEILSDVNLIKLTIGNPKEVDLNIWNGFAGTASVMSFSYNNFDISQTGDTSNLNALKLIIGSEPYTGNTQTTNYYVEFFSTNNIEFGEDNFRLFRPLVHIYAGYRKNGGTNTKSAFQNYLITKILSYTDIFNVGMQNRQDLYLNTIISKLVSLKSDVKTIQQTVFNGYNDTPIKLEQYNYFKSFNDKWVAGNSIGQRLLLEEFLFLDKANRDIGDKSYFTLEKLIPLEDTVNAKQNLYGLIGMLINGTGFDMRGLPAYVNFYGTNLSTKSKLTPSKKVAQNLFGTFLEVDYQESSPKIILQYTGPTSKHLEMSDVNKKYNFNDDSFNVGNPNNNPLVITIPDIFNNTDLSKSNKVVAFEVNFGDQNQGIFKGVQLDQSSIRNTTESFIAQENLGRSESGGGTAQVDIGLFDIYRQASYTCDVTCLGNVMIQPTMYFYLKNIPMFRGSYWITEVSHNIRGNNITTSFKGTRIPSTSLPDPKDSFMSSYRALFDRITKTAVAKVKQESLNVSGSTKNEKSISTDQGTFTVDMGAKEKEVKGEQIFHETGVTPFGVRYNGFGGEKYIQKVTYNKIQYFRAIAVGMGGKNYTPEDAIQMSIISRVTSKTVSGTTTNTNGIPVNYLTWKDIKDSKNKFYSLRFDLGVASANTIIKASTYFLNPKNNKNATADRIGENVETITQTNIKGPISVGPKIDGYGIALSQTLMTELGLFDGDVVYFNMS